MVEGAPHEYKEKAGACADCGNSPVNHFEQYVSNTLAVWSANALRKRRGPHHALTALFGKLFDASEQAFLRAIAAMPFARFSTDVKRAATYRSQVIWEEAERRGIRMEQLVIFGVPTEIYRAYIRGGSFYFQSLPVPYDMRGESIGWLDDKYALKQALSACGVPVPAATSVRTEAEAIQALAGAEGAVVVKPRSGSRGRHTTVNVKTEDEMRIAYAAAKKLCAYVSIERYVEGPVCRATVVNGALAGFFEAKPPSVVGDGRSSIRKLVERANASRPERIEPIVLTEEHERFLARRGLRLDSSPARGERVPLSHRTGRLFGGTTRELLGAEHPKLRAYLERAAGALQVAVVGFDLIIPDAEADPDAQVWGIIEANSLPYIDLHYLALEGAPSNVAARVWDLWAESMHSVPVDGREARGTITA